MSSFDDTKITAYLNDVLDPSEAHALEQELEGDPGLREHIRELQAKAYERALDIDGDTPPLSCMQEWTAISSANPKAVNLARDKCRWFNSRTAFAVSCRSVTIWNFQPNSAYIEEIIL